MIKVNAFALCLYRETAGKGKLAPPFVEICRQGEGSGVAKIILEFLAKTDHGVKVKTKRRVNDQYLNSIILRGNTMDIANSGAGGLCRRIPPSLFRHPAALPLPDFYEMIVG
jgi:hypothetical protein